MQQIVKSLGIPFLYIKCSTVLKATVGDSERVLRVLPFRSDNRVVSFQLPQDARPMHSSLR